MWLGAQVVWLYMALLLRTRSEGGFLELSVVLWAALSAAPAAVRRADRDDGWLELVRLALLFLVDGRAAWQRAASGAAVAARAARTSCTSVARTS